MFRPRAIGFIVAFPRFYTLTIAVIAILLALEGFGAITSLSAAASAVGNVRPGLSPPDNYASLPDAAKWELSAGMLMERLEMITVLVVPSPAFWRQRDSPVH